MFNDIKNFYPTPPHLVAKMLKMVEGYPEKILEPSAGKGDLIDAIKQHYGGCWGGPSKSIYAIEIDPTLQATLRGKGVKVLDSDFLAYAGADKFDLIIGNPPFEDGDKHLLWAIETMYRGQIIFLLNAETLRNPHTKTRKLLVRKLDELGATIEFHKNGFTVAERKTKVEVALVSLKIDRNVEEDLFAGCADHKARCHKEVSEKHEVSTGRTLEELVAEYNETIRIGTEVILTYYRHHKAIGKYLGLNAEAKDRSYSAKDLTGLVQNTTNELLESVRTDYWRRTLDLPEARSRLTKKKQDEFEHQLAAHCHMDFTESNIRQFVLNLIGTYEQTLTEAVLDIFDRFTIRHSWTGSPWEKNIHYFNGWKTNKSFKVGKRVVVPIRGSYDGPFYDSTFGRWKLNWNAATELRDIDLVMGYFDGNVSHDTLHEAVERSLEAGQSSGECSYFRFTCHKKGTIHLTFKDEDILRRFNLVACRGKGWLPSDYGAKQYGGLSEEEKTVVDGFEGKASYQENRKKELFQQKRLQVAA